MIRELRLDRFKNFYDATLTLGKLTVLVGTNASGKSNVRDAFRFLHGISRGYTLAEIIGEKWIEGGSQVWQGIRGGVREIAFWDSPRFALETQLSGGDGVYRIEVEAGSNGRPPRLVGEMLGGRPPFKMAYSSYDADEPLNQEDPQNLVVRLQTGKRLRFRSNAPVLAQIIKDTGAPTQVEEPARRVLSALGSMRFLELVPDAMRIPSLPGQDVLGDRGENLSSVLQAICESSGLKRAVLEWGRELTPLDVVDFEFPADLTGKILLVLVESGGRRTSAYSASDGTLRFLAVIAALLGPHPAQFYFIEELENGIHPTWLHLLLELIEHAVSDRAIQVVATSHSPLLLGFLSEQSRADAALLYRPEGRPYAEIRRIADIPAIQEVLKNQNLARLHESGWLENVMHFSQPEESEV